MSLQSTNSEMASLPIIDISPYLNPDSTEQERKKTSQDLDTACRTFGFFYVVGHGIPEEMMQTMLDIGHKFFELPQEKKDDIHIFKSMDRVRGYQKKGENVTYGKRDQQEGLDIYPEPENPSSEKLMGAQLWPSDEDIPGFKDMVLDYVERMLVVGKAFMRCMCDTLGHPEVFEELQRDPYWVLRMVGYPPLSNEHDAEQGISCGSHTDYGALTFLLADPFPGALQVEAKDGSWIPVQPIENAYVVNIGDIIDVLTNHAYKSTYHRVIHKGNKYRVSIPFFFEPPVDSVLKPLPGVQGEATNSKPVTEVKYFEHLKNMIYNHFVGEQDKLPDKVNANELTSRG